jgi:demethylspheroidene O-methyltransferase
MRGVKPIFGRLNGTISQSFFDRFCEWRNKLVANERFRKLAIASPLTRGLARRRASDLFDLCAGFVYSQVVLSCVRLGIFEMLDKRPLDLDALAGEIGLSREAALRLVNAGVALRLLERRSDDRVGLGELGAVLNANPGIKAMVLHHVGLYRDLIDPVALLRAEPGASAVNRFWAYATADDPARLSGEQVAEYSDLMSVSQQFLAEQVLDAYRIARHRRLLDVGGGDGTFALAAARSAPRLEVAVFDLPAVAERAFARFQAAGLSRRAKAVGGDFTKDALPEGADVISLVRVLYDHDDEKVLGLLKSVRKALPPGGRLLIAEPMAAAPGAGKVGDAYFGFYLLAMGSGRPRRPAEFALLLREAGFSRSRTVRTKLPLQTGLIVAEA